MLARISWHVMEDLYSKMLVSYLKFYPIDMVLQEDRKQETQLLVHHVVLAFSLLSKETLELALGNTYLIKCPNKYDVSQVIW